jgi:orotate phosphoribosyltransferase
VEAGALAYRPDEPVTFRSGLRSPVYVDGRRLVSHPGPWHVVVDALCDAISGGATAEAAIAADVVAGVEAAGIPHSSAVAYAASLPSVFVRKEAKGHGLGRRVEGGEIVGRRAVLIEDLVTTGGSSLSAIEALREAGATVADCLAITTYGFGSMREAFASAGVRLTVLTSIEDVVVEAVAAGSLEHSGATVIRGWLADPQGWSGASE